MNYRYTAYTKDGSKKSGTTEASSESDARSLIQADGLYVDSIAEVGKEIESSNASKPLFQGSQLKNVAAFTRQMSVLITSGTPIVQALEAVENQTSDLKWKAVLADIRSHVEEGASLAESMAQYPAFDELYRAMIAAGESGGDFQGILNRLTKIVRQELSIRNSVTGAMVYPMLLLVVASGVLVLLAFTVLPRFKELFETLDAPLPASTAVIMNTAEFAKSYWWVLVGIAGALGAGLYKWTRTVRGKRLNDIVIVKAPMFGKIVREFKTAKFARVLGVLMEAKVPLLESLEIAQTSANNALYEDLIVSARDRVERGESMSDAFSGSPLLSTSVCEAIRNGEQTGRVGEVLMSLADIMDEDNDIVVRSLTSIIEPLILVVLGVLVGFIALSLFLPLFDLTASTGAG
jgi:type IV pilus assembly protein PilC